MAAFTTITNGMDLQQLSLINEITNAFYERRYCIGDGTGYWSGLPAAVASQSAGYDLQDHANWSTIQNWLEHYCTWFIDPAVDQTALTYTQFYTLAQMRTKAGITSGFRRVTGTSWPTDWTDYSDAAFSYGKCQEGDVIGPWLWTDIQKVFSVLTQTQAYAGMSNGTITSQIKIASAGYGNPCATMYSNEQTAWAGASFVSGPSSNIQLYRAFAQADNVAGSYYLFNDLRQSGIPVFYNVPITNPCVIDLYCIAGPETEGTFKDIDGKGLVQNKLFKVETLASAQTATRTGSQEGLISASPILLSGLSCGNYGVYECYLGGNFFPIMKWAFSYA